MRTTIRSRSEHDLSHIECSYSRADFFVDLTSAECTFSMALLPGPHPNLVQLRRQLHRRRRGGKRVIRTRMTLNKCALYMCKPALRPLLQCISPPRLHTGKLSRRITRPTLNRRTEPARLHEHSHRKQSRSDLDSSVCSQLPSAPLTLKVSRLRCRVKCLFSMTLVRGRRGRGRGR